MGKYTSVSILRTQFLEIRELIFEKDWMGYRNASEFVREAVRHHISRCKMEISSQKERRDDDY